MRTALLLAAALTSARAGGETLRDARLMTVPADDSPPERPAEEKVLSAPPRSGVPGVGAAGEAPGQEVDAHGDLLIIRIGGPRCVKVHGELVGLDRLADLLRSHADLSRDVELENRPSEKEVGIEAEAGLRWRDVLPVLDVCVSPPVRIHRIRLGLPGQSGLPMDVPVEWLACSEDSLVKWENRPLVEVSLLRPPAGGDPALRLFDTLPGSGRDALHLLRLSLRTVHAAAGARIDSDDDVPIADVLRCHRVLAGLGIENVRYAGVPPDSWHLSRLRRSLHGVSTEESIPILVAAAFDRDFRVRDFAARNLREAGSPAIPCIIARVERSGTGVAPGRLQEIDGPSGRHGPASELLGMFGEVAVPHLLLMLRSGEPFARQVAAEALGIASFVSDDVLEALEGTLRDPDPDVRRAALDACIHLGSI